MPRRPKLLLQSTIPYVADDWHVGRFSLLSAELAKHADVTARDLEPDAHGTDPVLSHLELGTFDEIWLLGVDDGTALSESACEHLQRFHANGGGLLTTRDHGNMGLWLHYLGDVGLAHYFHEAAFCEPDPDRQRQDDQDTPTVPWPNYHSGRNGDVQTLSLAAPPHPLLVGEAQRPLVTFPAHPHEGAVGVLPSATRGRVVAYGTSAVTGRTFGAVAAFERNDTTFGRAVAESSFHHFADYNWDTSLGAPSFVVERPGDQLRQDPGLLADIRTYIGNVVRWLAPRA